MVNDDYYIVGCMFYSRRLVGLMNELFRGFFCFNNDLLFWEILFFMGMSSGIVYNFMVIMIILNFLEMFWIWGEVIFGFDFERVL